MSILFMATADQSDFSSQMICRVCGSDKVVKRLQSSGAPACAACKKFFVRNCVADFSCIDAINGGNCLDKLGHNLKQECLAANRKRYIFCQKCRIDRCLEIGMMPRVTSSLPHEKASLSPDSASSSQQVEMATFASNYEDNMASSNKSLVCHSSSIKAEEYCSESSTPSPYFSKMVFHPVRLECIDAENAVTSLTSNVSLLQQLPRLSMDFQGDVYSMRSIWPTWSERIANAVQLCSKFAKTIPGFSTLNINDRQLLFKLSFNPISIAQSTQPNIAVPPFLGIDKWARSIMFYHCPCLKSVESRAMEVQKLMKDWNPSTAEFAVLQGILFYNHSSGSGLIQPDDVARYQRSLLMAMSCLIASSGSDKDVRWYRFNEVARLLTGVTELFYDFFDAVVLHPDSLHFDDQLFREVFSK